jgi:hypothetical protein
MSRSFIELRWDANEHSEKESAVALNRAAWSGEGYL